jgi:hypothetical protein
MLRLLLQFALLTGTLSAACLPYTEAPDHIGDTLCVAGKVVKVSQSPSGTWFLNFCEDYRQCPFSVVVFASNLRDVGDVRQLEGKDIEIHGKVKQYNGRAEIVLSRLRQLRGEAANIPPAPKEYDVQRHGSFSAGKFRHPQKRRPERQDARRPPAPPPADDDR